MEDDTSVKDNFVVSCGYCLLSKLKTLIVLSECEFPPYTSKLYFQPVPSLQISRIKSLSPRVQNRIF